MHYSGRMTYFTADEERWAANKIREFVAEYDRRAGADEAARAEFGEDYDLTYAVAGEDATLIPESLVALDR